MYKISFTRIFYLLAENWSCEFKTGLQIHLEQMWIIMCLKIIIYEKWTRKNSWHNNVVLHLRHLENKASKYGKNSVTVCVHKLLLSLQGLWIFGNAYVLVLLDKLWNETSEQKFQWDNYVSTC